MLTTDIFLYGLSITLLFADTLQTKIKLNWNLVNLLDPDSSYSYHKTQKSLDFYWWQSDYYHVVVKVGTHECEWQIAYLQINPGGSYKNAVLCSKAKMYSAAK